MCCSEKRLFFLSVNHAGSRTHISDIRQLELVQLTNKLSGLFLSIIIRYKKL